MEAWDCCGFAEGFWPPFYDGASPFSMVEDLMDSEISDWFISPSPYLIELLFYFWDSFWLERLLIFSSSFSYLRSELLPSKRRSSFGPPLITSSISPIFFVLVLDISTCFSWYSFLTPAVDKFSSSPSSFSLTSFSRLWSVTSLCLLKTSKFYNA